MAVAFVHFNYLVTFLPITYVYDKIWLEGTENEFISHTNWTLEGYLVTALAITYKYVNYKVWLEGSEKAHTDWTMQAITDVFRCCCTYGCVSTFLHCVSHGWLAFQIRMLMCLILRMISVNANVWIQIQENTRISPTGIYQVMHILFGYATVSRPLTF
jgi:hypothetical protein